MISFLRLLVAMVIVAFYLDSAFSKSKLVDTGLHVTDILMEKWEIIFDMVDGNNDGTCTVEDIHSLAQRLIHYSHASEEQVDGIMQFWQLYIEVIDDYFGVDNTKTGLTKSEFVMSLVSYWSRHFDAMKRRIQAFYTAFFHAIDTDNDGVVNFEEFQPYYKQFGINGIVDDKGRKAFQIIDSDDNGVISEDEFRDIYLKFCLDPDITLNELPLF